MIPGFANELSRWWRESGTSTPNLTPAYSEAEQAAREAQTDRFLEAVSSESRRLPAARASRTAAEERLGAAFRRFAEHALGFSAAEVELLVSGGFTTSAKELVRAAKRFDRNISGEDVFQAARNVWTTNGLQAILGLPVQLTPAVFAYSMLYPYTDNYLDSPKVARQAKAAFNSRFGRRLAGEDVAPCGGHEESVWSLIGLIERQFDRDRHPQVFESLLAIHRAQTRSVLLHRRTERDAPDVLLIGFEKGGASVLADAYLAAGSLTQAEAEFAFAWGVLLQLGDDAQDVVHDAEAGILTVFSRQAGRCPLDGVMNRVFHFAGKVFELLDRLPGGSETMKALVKKSANTLLINAVGEAARLYSPPYIAKLENYSPLRFSFLSERRRRLLRNAKPLTRLLESFADDETAAYREPAASLCVSSQSSLPRGCF